jgi:hypothetical protein
MHQCDGTLCRERPAFVTGHDLQSCRKGASKLWGFSPEIRWHLLASEEMTGHEGGQPGPQRNTVSLGWQESRSWISHWIKIH